MKEQTYTKRKYSLYFKDNEEKLMQDIELLAQYDGVSYSVILKQAITEYAQRRQCDLEFMQKHKQELLDHKAQQAQQVEQPDEQPEGLSTEQVSTPF